MLFVALLCGAISCSKQERDPSSVFGNDLRVVSPIGVETYAQDGSLSAEARQSTLVAGYLKYYEFKRIGANQEALELLVQMTEVDHTSAHLFRLLAAEFAEQGGMEEALHIIAKAQKLEPDNPEVLRDFVRYLHVQNLNSEALLLVEKLLKDDPADEESLALALKIDLSRGDYWVAVNRVKAALKEKPRSEFLHFKMGRVLTEMGKHDQARKSFEAALRISPNYYQASTFLAIVSEELEDFDRALELYEQLASETNNVIYYRKLGQLAVQKEKFDLARNAYETILQKDPGDLLSHYELLKVYLNQSEDFESVANSMRSILAIEPQNESTRFSYAMLLENHGQYNEAWRQVSMLDKSSDFYQKFWPNVANVKLRILQNTMDKEGFHELLQESIVFLQTMEDPEMKERFYLTLARVQLAMHSFEEASVLMSEAARVFPDSISVLFLQGIVFEKLRKYDQGILAMQKILEQDPDHAGALNYIGYTWAEQGINLEEAHSYIKKALALKPNDPYIQDSLGWVLYKMERYEEAYDHLMTAFLQVPNEYVVVDHLADVLVKLGRLSEARDYYVRASHLEPDRKEDEQALQKKLADLKKQHPHIWASSATYCQGFANRRCRPFWDSLQHDTPTEKRSTASSTR